MKIRVKQCMTPSDITARFEAEVGDVVLLSNGNRSYVEATIRSITSADAAVVAILEGAEEVQREIQTSDIHGLMLGG